MSDSSKKKDCNCGKKTRTYSEEDLKKQSSNGSKISMVRSFATSLASRGLKNKKTTEPIKKLRVLSCFGNEHLGGELPPCQHIHESKTPGKYFCGGCGCGDRKATWLISDSRVILCLAAALILGVTMIEINVYPATKDKIR